MDWYVWIFTEKNSLNTIESSALSNYSSLVIAIREIFWKAFDNAQKVNLKNQLLIQFFSSRDLKGDGIFHCTSVEELFQV